MKRGTNTRGDLPCCPPCQTLGSRVGVGWGGEAGAPTLMAAHAMELMSPELTGVLCSCYRSTDVQHRL